MQFVAYTSGLRRSASSSNAQSRFANEGAYDPNIYYLEIYSPLPHCWAVAVTLPGLLAVARLQ